MSDSNNQSASPGQDNQVTKVSVNFAENIDYKYRDILNIFVGRGDVVFELGNIHRSVPDQATIADRIVVSMASAYDFHARLGQALKEAQEKLQQEMTQSR